MQISQSFGCFSPFIFHLLQSIFLILKKLLEIHKRIIIGMQYFNIIDGGITEISGAKPPLQMDGSSLAKGLQHVHILGNYQSEG
jgi:hypothetical protein